VDQFLKATGEKSVAVVFGDAHEWSVDDFPDPKNAPNIEFDEASYHGGAKEAGDSPSGEYG